jgi:hypothetical protein
MNKTFLLTLTNNEEIRLSFTKTFINRILMNLKEN